MSRSPRITRRALASVLGLALACTALTGCSQEGAPTEVSFHLSKPEAIPTSAS